MGNIIGIVLPWFKSITGVPLLPNKWTECNGQVLNDSDSPLNGQTLPDLNGNNYFLRGNSTSGGTGGLINHSHTVPITKGGDTDYDGGSAVAKANISFNANSNSGSVIPSNQTCVWIIKVK